MTRAQLLKENELRKIEPLYDPKTGLGAYGERKKVTVSEFGTMYLPLSFLQVGWIKKVVAAKSIDAYCHKVGMDDEYEKLVTLFIKERFKHDPEFWFATQAKIKIKNQRKDGYLIASPTQRKVLYELLDDWYAGRPVRAIIVKCRQAFITTLMAAFNMWVQINLFESWDSLICGDVENQATNARGMQDKIATGIDILFTNDKRLEFTPYEGSSKTRILSGRSCKVSTGSMQKPENVRCGDTSSAHLTEVGLWRTTKGKTPEDLIQAIRGGMDDVEYTVFTLESSPKGTGNYFYRQYQAAKKGESDLKPIFLPWFLVPRYSKKIDDYDKFFDLFFKGDKKDYLQYLWSLGITLEKINWYIGKLLIMEHWRVQSEWPSDDVEAFQSTGRRVFSMKDVQKRRLECIKPIFLGDICGQEQKGEDALKNIRLELINSFLKIWAYPDYEEVVTDRYLVIVDIGKGKSAKADYSDILVLDRYGLMYGDRLEVVAEWHGRIDIDLLAWKAAQIGTYYRSKEVALLAIEKNTIDTITEYANVLFSELGDWYENLYAKVEVDKITNITTKTLGFHTNTNTKPLVVEAQQAAVRDDLYYERNDDACVEMDTYELKEDGKFGAADGCHDDMVMVRAIGMHISKKMDIPKVIVKHETIKKKVVGLSSM